MKTFTRMHFIVAVLMLSMGIFMFAGFAYADLDLVSVIAQIYDNEDDGSDNESGQDDKQQPEFGEDEISASSGTLGTIIGAPEVLYEAAAGSGTGVFLEPGKVYIVASVTVDGAFVRIDIGNGPTVFVPSSAINF